LLRVASKAWLSKKKRQAAISILEVCDGQVGTEASADRLPAILDAVAVAARRSAAGEADAAGE
jgi:hypothetical protein